MTPDLKRLIPILDEWASSKLDTQVRAIRALCRAGAGVLTEPTPHMSHEYELDMYGVHARGSSERALVKHWFQVAQTERDGAILKGLAA